MEVQLFTRRLTGGQHGFMSWQWVRPYVNTGFSLVATRRTDKDAVLEALGVDASDSEVLTWDGALEEFLESRGWSGGAPRKAGTGSFNPWAVTFSLR